MSHRHLKFPLDVEDGWPPAGVESLPVEVRDGEYEILDAPLYIKDVSVGDRIAATLGDDGLVSSWRHIGRSDRTTIWLLRLRQTDSIAPALSKLRSIGCNTVSMDALGSYAVDVPRSVPIQVVDEVLATLDGSEVAVAYPSMRHPEPD
jgi:hypothetical protein